jgi:hypothetical protein
MKPFAKLGWMTVTCMGLACQRDPLPMGTAQVTGGQSLTVSAAAYGDDFVQLMAAADCAELVAFRNFPSWQFDSCETCFGKPIGGGILSSSGALCGHAYGRDWVSTGDCGAALTVESSTSEELHGTLRIDKSTGGSLTLEFRAARRTLRERPPTSSLATLCDASAADRLGSAVCCNWGRDAQCGKSVFEASCRN